jgi:hypothetical protein
LDDSLSASSLASPVYGDGGILPEKKINRAINAIYSDIFIMSSLCRIYIEYALDKYFYYIVCLIELKCTTRLFLSCDRHTERHHTYGG